MPVEKSAGAIIFRKKPFDAVQGKSKKIYFLLLHYPARAKRRAEDEGKLRRRQTSSTGADKEYWDLPKGHIEKGEKELDTVKREVKEETGLSDIKIMDGFKETIKYFFQWERKNILKFVTFFLAETKTEEVKISDEHVGFIWLPYEEALEKLTFKNAKDILKKANEYLSRKGL